MEYNYQIEAMLTYGQENFPLSNVIKSIILNFDYDRKNMPEIFLSVSLSNEQYSVVESHRNDANIILTLYKFDASSSSPLKQKYISDSFSYIMTSDPNYNQGVTAGSNQRFTNQNNDQENEMEATSYLSGHIALIKEESLNDNKQLNNAIIKDSNVMSIIHRFTSHMKMVIEQIDSSHNKIVPQLIIKPTDTITNLLKYINSEYPFYESGYRYFRDFNRTYLMSNSGKPLDLHDESYNKVLIIICDQSEVIDSGVAMEIDEANKSYIIRIEATSSTSRQPQEFDKNYNSIVSIDSDGNVSETPVSNSAHPNSAKKAQLEYSASGNDSMQNKSFVESAGSMLIVTKANLDSSIITPNKEYTVKNYNGNSSQDGRYVLSYKKEVIAKEGNNFIISTVFGLRKGI